MPMFYGNIHRLLSLKQDTYLLFTTYRDAFSKCPQMLNASKNVDSIF